MKDIIRLSDKFTYGRLLRFTLPTIGMMVFTSLYGIVDGFFVSNFAGKMPFAAINFAWPVLGMLGIVGFMFGTGGNAIISRLFGQKEKETHSLLSDSRKDISILNTLLSTKNCGRLKNKIIK